MGNASSSKVWSGFYTVNFGDTELFSELADDLKGIHAQVRSSSNTRATFCKKQNGCRWSRSQMRVPPRGKTSTFKNLKIKLDK